MAAGATYEPIATTTLASAAATITFSSIPSTYTDLKVIYVIRSTIANDFMQITVNGATTNYSLTYLTGDGTSASSSRTTNSSCWYFGGYGAGYIPTAANMFALGTIDLFSYSGSTNKTALATWSADRNGTGGATERYVGLYRSTSAITTIKLETFNSAGGSNYIAAGTTATLYGIKAA